MKKELIRVLKKKLDDIKDNINSLNELNGKIKDEEGKLAYATKILEIFKSDHEYEIMNFSKLSKSDFESVLKVVNNDAEKIFSTGSCNYDGLVYLINGINNGVSLTLTDEQKSGIEYLIKGLQDKEEEYKSAIDGFNLVKTRYPISDVSELENKKNDYETVLDKIDDEKYITETDLLLEAIEFDGMKKEDTISLLTYVLEFNADVYKNNKDKYVEEKKEEVKQEIPTYVEEEKPEEFHFQEVPQSVVDIPPITFEEEKIEVPTETIKEEAMPEIPQVSIETPVVNEIPPISMVEEPKEEKLEEIPPFGEEITPPIVNIEPEKPEEVPTPMVEEYSPVTPSVPEVDNDFKDIINEKSDYEEPKLPQEEKTSTREIQRLFGKYNIKEPNEYLNELVTGSIDNYKNVLDTLKDNSLVEEFDSNSQLLIETLLYSNSENIKNVLQIIKNDLSVDDDDYKITTRIAIDTIPSIFVNETGNYENFIKNVQTFKNIGLNLINLFDFSKEIFVADNKNILRNLEVVRKYGFEINYKNAKYLLLINNIGEKLDYYVESVYEDKLRKETFDGIEYINNYAAKLNVVTDETIKRLRFASENGKKVFGTKPKSLSGEITNLKVNALEMTDDYANKFFNNNFANISSDEVREYVKLIRNSTNVGNYADELSFLESLHKGLRYVIENINVSYNKVLRNYNILRSYSIDSRKALEFAICYNLVITKDEYQRLKSKLDEMGGNL